MALNQEALDAKDRLENKYNGNAYNAETNSGGMAAGGSRTNYIPAIRDVATVAEAIANETEAAATNATNSASSASSASASASAAASSETNAETSATNAAVYKTSPKSSAANSGLIDNPPLKLNPFNAGKLISVGAPPKIQHIKGNPIIKKIEVKKIGNCLPVFSCLFFAHVFIKKIITTAIITARNIYL